MELPKVSIIIPIYNAESFLDKCITSLISQSYSNLEILLINDGSTDNSLDICNSYAKHNSGIKVIDKKNGGVASARNKGLDLATGTYIGFVDSDDFVSDLMYEKMVGAMIENNADVVESGYYTCDVKYKNIKKHELKETIIDGSYQCSYIYLAKENTTDFNCNKLYNKSLFNDLSYPDYKYSEDYWVNTMIFYKCQRKVTLKECYYYYVMNDQSAVNGKFDINNRIDSIKAAQELYDFHSNHFSNLCPFIALYICKYVLSFYYKMDENNNENKEYFEQELKLIFNKYFPEIKKSNAFEEIQYKRIHIYMIIFQINPKLFLNFKKMHLKLKTKYFYKQSLKNS